MADQAHLVVKPVARDQGGEVIAIGGLAGRIAGENDDGAVERAFSGKKERGLDRIAVPLEAGEARRLKHDLGPGLDAPTFSELGHGLGWNRARLESVRIDAAMDGANARLRGGMPRGDKPRGVVRIGDHAVAAAHNAVVDTLHGTRVAVGAVIGGDEGSSRPARGDERAPGRRPASGMDEIDAAFLDQLREPARIGENGERVLARDGKRNDLAAGIGDGGCQSASFGGNESRGACARKRLRDLDGRLLAASGIEARHDLQYGHLRHGTRFLR